MHLGLDRKAMPMYILQTLALVRTIVDVRISLCSGHMCFDDKIESEKFDHPSEGYPVWS